ncbi:hypothetical protein [Bauldia sp.]|uniref:hypothetical protein n=1 Tax=Bauldia sp. TaxID=2575872 RepID=UPI003BA97D99
MRVKLFSAIGIGTFVLIGSGPAFADCSPMELFAPGAERNAQFADLDGSGGVSVGDQRLSRHALVGPDGSPVGTRYTVTSVVSIDDEGNAHRSGEYIFVLDDGVIIATRPGETPHFQADVDNTDTRLSPKHDVPRIITGGFGAYEGATGTFTTTRGDGFDTLIVLDVAC